MAEDAWLNRWEERYSGEAFAYGTAPNHYLKEQLTKISQGKILFAAEGEGRNAVFAASLGWEVAAFDISTEGKNKAMKLAEARGVEIDYRVGELETLGFAKEQFDVIALIYAHFPAAIKSLCHQALDKYLRKGGIIIFEAFSKKHIDYLSRNENVGGPKDIASLFSMEELEADFSGYEFQELMETEVELSEGLYHNGLGSVIRCIARKK
ncbi:class I SAM-dependent methyltransferase [Pedobacter sp. AW31-3R]|uniref:class I SAM-dependent methyltransferase n=1 Tax=Pedobacter sp. AW31-3R TaxID=3445781 RepID=UPI003F9F3C41